MRTPYKQRWFEDYAPGETVQLGSYEVSEQEILAFAERYDPQPFHTDRDMAADSIYGSLIASGWMTAAIMMRLLVDGFISEVASMGSPGVDELRWLEPVRAGDTISARVTVLEARRSASKPDRGVLRLQIEATNQLGHIVAKWTGLGLYRTRPGRD